MALRNCEDCGYSFSSSANECPRCGCIHNTHKIFDFSPGFGDLPSWLNILLVFVVIGVLLIYLLFFLK